MALNYYRLLGIPSDAGLQRIKTAYRSLAKRFHPDRNHGSETAAELFRQINDAYRVLSDPRLRADYDRKLAEAARPAPEPADDPQQKFQKFVSSLLDALFGPLDEPTAQRVPQPPPAEAARAPRTPRPGFNFHYHQALEKQSAPYIRGRDGIYRKNPAHRTSRKRRRPPPRTP